MSSFLGPCPTELLTQWVYTVTGAATCADLAHAVDWLNEQAPPPWDAEWTGTFNTPASTVPDSSGLGGGGYGGGIESLMSTDGTNGSAVKDAYSSSASSYVLLGSGWTPGGCEGGSATCIFSGVVSPCGASAPSYIYNVPVPSVSICTGEVMGGSYTLKDYVVGWPEWLESYAGLTGCSALATPGPCLSGDPFFGDDPP